MFFMNICIILIMEPSYYFFYHSRNRIIAWQNAALKKWTSHYPYSFFLWVPFLNQPFICYDFIWILSLSRPNYSSNKNSRVEAFNSTQFNKWVYEGKAPALPESLRLYKKLRPLGIKVVFITGRPEAQRKVTKANLRNVGFHSWKELICRGSSETGTAVVYKSQERKRLEESGYRIIGNIGDQWSDILGTNTGARTFKLPDPMYYISWWHFD